MKTMELMKILSSETKARIIYALYDRNNKELGVSDMCDYIQSKQANGSKHLMALREAGVVTGDKNGREVKYKISEDFYNEHKELLDFLRNSTDLCTFEDKNV